MYLIIPYGSKLTKERLSGLGEIPCEVLVNAARFRRQATLFCLACHASKMFNARHDLNRCKNVLGQVRTYRMLRKYDWMINNDSMGRAMSTRILTDINRRMAEKQEDTLAIMANCCGYVVRLNSKSLSAASVSLSAAIIALFFLNGEVMWNDSRSVTTENVSHLLAKLSFNRFDPPVESKALSFMKQCRLVNVRLTKEGVVTTGHLWRVEERVATERRQQEKCQHTSDMCQRLCLKRIAAILATSRPQLAAQLRQCMRDGVSQHLDHHGLREIFQRMLSTLCEAIHAGKQIVVACLVDSPQDGALFVSKRHVRLQDSFVFTACQPARYSKLVNKYRSAVKYVSLLFCSPTLAYATRTFLFQLRWVSTSHQWLMPSKPHRNQTEQCCSLRRYRQPL